MKYLKKYESFYNENFKIIKEEMYTDKDDVDKDDVDKDDVDKDDEEISDVMNDEDSEDEESSVESKTFESNGESEEGSEDEEDEQEVEGLLRKKSCSSCDDSGEDEEDEEDDENGKIDEGAFKKWATGHSSKEEKDDKKLKFKDELDKLDEEGADKNPKVVYNRAAIEKKAKENNYKGGIRVSKGGRDKSKVYVVYDDGYSGFQSLAGAAGDKRREIIG